MHKANLVKIGPIFFRKIKKKNYKKGYILHYHSQILLSFTCERRESLADEVYDVIMLQGHWCYTLSLSQ